MEAVNENVVNNELIQEDIINVEWSNINEDNVLPQRTRGVQLNVKEIVPPIDKMGVWYNVFIDLSFPGIAWERVLSFFICL